MGKKQNETVKKKRNLRGLFENNQFNVVISIVIAVIAWLIISMYIKPQTTNTITDIPVKLDYNASAYQSMG